MQTTSLSAYDSILADLPRRKRQVYEVLARLGPMSNMQIAIELNLPINYITGRTNSLVKDGLVREYDKTLDLISNMPVIRWSVVPINTQLKLTY